MLISVTIIGEKEALDRGFEGGNQCPRQSEESDGWCVCVHAVVPEFSLGQCETKRRKEALLERRLAIDAIGGVETCKCALGTGVERHYDLPRTVLEYVVKEVEGKAYKLTDRYEKDEDCDHEWGAHECGCYQVLGGAFMDVHGQPIEDMVTSCKDDIKVRCSYYDN
jgi:hypothetical protein